MSIRGLTPAKTLDQLRQHRRLYPNTAACLHPECANRVDYPGDGPGRRPLFCSKNCTQDYAAHRYVLHKEIAALENAINDAGPRSSNARDLHTQLSHAKWHLARYGGI